MNVLKVKPRGTPEQSNVLAKDMQENRRLSIDVPREVHRRLKSMAVAQDKHINQIVNKIILDELEKYGF